MPTPNRRRNLREWMEELEDARYWHRPPRPFLKDVPTYPWVEKNYNSPVTFDLNYSHSL